MATNDGRRYTRNPNRGPGGSGRKVWKYGQLVDPTVPITPEVIYGPPKRAANTRDPRYPKHHQLEDYPDGIVVTRAKKDTPIGGEADCRSFAIWGAFGGGAALLFIVLLIIILWVFGEMTGDSPVLKGYFG